MTGKRWQQRQLHGTAPLEKVQLPARCKVSSSSLDQLRWRNPTGQFYTSCINFRYFVIVFLKGSNSLAVHYNPALK